MSISLYQVSVPCFIHNLKALAGILDKGAKHAEAKGIDPSVLLNARLFPDMFPLLKQVQVSSDGAKGTAARLAGVEIPKMEDNETTFAQIAHDQQLAAQHCAEPGLQGIRSRPLFWLVIDMGMKGRVVGKGHAFP